MSDALPRMDANRASRVHRVIQEAFIRRRVPIAGTALEQELEGIERLASRGAAFLVAPDEAAERARYFGAWRSLLRFDGVARALDVCRDMPGFQRLLRRIRPLRVPRAPEKCRPKPSDREAWDILFEIEIAARMRTSGRVRFAEPDVIVDEEAGSYGIACKRPQSTHGIGKSVAVGMRQIAKANVHGFVAVDIELGDSGFIAGPNQSETWDLAQQVLDGVASPQRHEIEARLRDEGPRSGSPESTAGVILMSRFVAVYPGPEGQFAHVPRWHFYPIAVDGDSGVGLMKVLIMRLIESEPRHPFEFDQ